MYYAYSKYSKMAKTLKKQNNNFTENHNTLELTDCICPICMYIFIEPVTMPCGHELCLSCFKMHVFGTSLECPFCRKRMASWARKMARNNRLINKIRWKNIKAAFPEKVQRRIDGIEDSDEDEYVGPRHQLSKPGEIGKEYQDEIKKIEEERERQRKAEEEASAALIRQLQESEDEQQQSSHRQQLGDEQLARQLMSSQKTPTSQKSSAPERTPTLLDKFMSKSQTDSNASATPRPCYTPTDTGKVISADMVTREQYPYVSEEFLREKRIDPAVIHAAGKPRRDGNITDFIYISDSPVCITIGETPVPSTSHNIPAVNSHRNSLSATKPRPTSKMRDWLTKSVKKKTPASATVSRPLTTSPADDVDSNLQHNSPHTQATSCTSAGVNTACVVVKLESPVVKVETPAITVESSIVMVESPKKGVKQELTTERSIFETKGQGEEAGTSSTNQGTDIAASNRSPRDHSSDSISLEFNHFRPVRVFPRTPPKRLADGSLHRPPLVHTTPTYADGTPRCTSTNAVTTTCLDFCNSPKSHHSGAGDGPPSLAHSTLVRRRLQQLRTERQEKVKNLSKGTSMRAGEASSGEGHAASSSHRAQPPPLSGKSRRKRKYFQPSYLVTEDSCSASSVQDSCTVTPARLTGTDTPLLPALPLEVDLTYANTESADLYHVNDYETAVSSQYDSALFTECEFVRDVSNGVTVTQSRISDVITCSDVVIGDDVIANCDDVTMTRSDAAKSADFITDKNSPTVNLTAFFESIKNQENSCSKPSTCKTFHSGIDEETSLGIFTEFFRKAKDKQDPDNVTHTDFFLPLEIRQSSSCEQVERWLESCTDSDGPGHGADKPGAVAHDINENYDSAVPCVAKEMKAKRRLKTDPLHGLDSRAKKSKPSLNSAQQFKSKYKKRHQKQPLKRQSQLSMKVSQKPPPGPSARTRTSGACHKAQRHTRRTRAQSDSAVKLHTDCHLSITPSARKPATCKAARGGNVDSDLSDCESVASRTRSQAPGKLQRRGEGCKTRYEPADCSDSESIASRTRSRTPLKQSRPAGRGRTSRDHAIDMSDVESVSSRTSNHKLKMQPAKHTPLKNKLKGHSSKSRCHVVISDEDQDQDGGDTSAMWSPDRPKRARKLPRRYRNDTQSAGSNSLPAQTNSDKLSPETASSLVDVDENSRGSMSKRERKLPARYRDDSESASMSSVTKANSCCLSKDVRRHTGGSDMFVTSDDEHGTSGVSTKHRVASVSKKRGSCSKQSWNENNTNTTRVRGVTSETKSPRRSARKRDVSEDKENSCDGSTSRDRQASRDADVHAVTRRIFSDVSATSSVQDADAGNIHIATGIPDHSSRNCVTKSPPSTTSKVKGKAQICGKQNTSLKDIFASSADDDIDSEVSAPSGKTIQTSKTSALGKRSFQSKLCFTRNTNTLDLVRNDSDTEDFLPVAGAKSNNKATKKSSSNKSAKNSMKKSKLSRMPIRGTVSSRNPHKNTNVCTLSRNHPKSKRQLTESPRSCTNSESTCGAQSSRPPSPWQPSPSSNSSTELHEPRLGRERFSCDAEFAAYTELQDRLYAQQLQLDFDLEHKYQLNAIRRKGVQDEYQLRAHRRPKAVQ